MIDAMLQDLNHFFNEAYTFATTAFTVALVQSPSPFNFDQT
jgi:hypothetical protein